MRRALACPRPRSGWRFAPPRKLVSLVRWAALLVVLLVAGRLIGTLLIQRNCPDYRASGRCRADLAGLVVDPRVRPWELFHLWLPA